MEAHVPQQTAAAEMTPAAHQQQQQRRDQLAPAAPPAQLITLVPQPLQLIIRITGLAGKSQRGQALQHGIDICWRLHFHPGRAAQQIDAGLGDAGLGAQTLLDSADAAAAFHPFDVEQQRLRGHGARLGTSPHQDTGHTGVLPVRARAVPRSQRR